MTRVLLATPLHGQPVAQYTLGLADVMLNAKDAEYVPCIQTATYVQTGRNQLVAEARKRSCDEIIFWDADVGATAADVLRLRSHNEDVVGGVYAKRRPGDPIWTAHASGEPPEGDLVPVNDIATGFLRVKMSVFDKLDAFLAGRRTYQHQGEEPRTEYFAVQRLEKNGWRTPDEAHLDALGAVLSEFDDKGWPSVPLWRLMGLKGQEIASEVVGEDVGWCRLCRAAGITPYADTKLMLRHYGQIGFPAEERPFL